MKKMFLIAFLIVFTNYASASVFESVKDAVSKKEDLLTSIQEMKRMPLKQKKSFETWAEENQNETILAIFMDETYSNYPRHLLMHLLLNKRAEAGHEKSPSIERTVKNYFHGYFDEMYVKSKLIQKTGESYKIALIFTFVPSLGNTEYVTFEVNVTEEGYEIVGEKRSVDGTLNC